MSTLPRSAAARRARGRRAHHDGLLIAATVLAGALAGLVQWPVAAAEPVFAAANVLVTAAFFLNGLLLARVREQRPTALALVLLAVFYAVGWLNLWKVGPLPLAAEVLGPLAPAFGAWALLRYPDSRLVGRVERAFVVAAFAWLPGVQALLVPFSLPAWHGFGAAAWWPVLWPRADLYAAGHGAYEVIVAGLSAVFVVLLLVQLARRGGLDRRMVAPLAGVSVAAAAAVSTQAAGLIAGLPRPAMDQVFTASALILLLIPMGFLTAAVRARLARSAVADLVVRLARPGQQAPDACLTALREVLCDPTLDLIAWGRGEGTGADAGGAGPDAPQRLAVPVSAQDGEPLAVVLADPALDRHRDLLDAALAACGLAMQRARLEVVLAEHRRDPGAHPLLAGPYGELDQLTGRERAVLELMAAGRSNAGIGRLLHLSPKTVEGHVASLFLKLGFSAGPYDNRRVMAVRKWLLHATENSSERPA